MTTINASAPNDDDDYPTPTWWERPSWWRDELDEAIPMARYLVLTRAQASQTLYRAHNPERHRDLCEARKVKHRLKQAPAKVAEFAAKVAHLQARIPLLEFAVEHGVAKAPHVTRDDLSAYSSTWDAARDLERDKRRLTVSRRALENWRSALDELIAAELA